MKSNAFSIATHAGAHPTGLPLDRLPVFGREGHVLPLGRAVQHTGEIDGSDPVDEIIAFGIPNTPPPPGIGALALDRGMLSGAGRVRGFGCTPLAEPGFWRFLA